MIRSVLFSAIFWAVSCSTTTTPVGPEPQPAPHVVRYIAGGDSRDDGAHVLPWALSEAKARGASAFIFLGDMELTPTLDARFAAQLPLLGEIPFYPALGNHEIKVLGDFPFGQNRAEKVFRAHFLGTVRTPVSSALPDRVVYSVNLYGGVHFVALDNVTAESFGAEQLAWLETDLAGAKGAIIVGMHRPLYGNGVTTHAMSSSSDSDRALDIFVRHHVALILASHEHLFAGPFRQGGIESYITGGLGAPLAVGAAGAFHHFLQVDYDGQRFNVTVVRFPGASSNSSKENEYLDD